MLTFGLGFMLGGVIGFCVAAIIAAGKDDN